MFPKCISQDRLNFAAITNHLKNLSQFLTLMKFAVDLGGSLGQRSSVFSRSHGFLLLASPSQHSSRLQMKKESEDQTSVVNCFASKFGPSFSFPFLWYELVTWPYLTPRNRTYNSLCM